MPMYTYHCPACNRTQERVIPISRRDDCWCADCEVHMDRKIDRPGMVWSPTKSGGNHS
jgi:putative FmdB family regulatory protein